MIANYIFDPIISRKYTNTFVLILILVMLIQIRCTYTSVTSKSNQLTTISKFEEKIETINKLSDPEFDKFHSAIYLRHNVNNIIKKYNKTMKDFTNAIMDRAIKVVSYEIEYDINAKTSNELRDILIKQFMNSELRDFPNLKRSISISISTTLFNFIFENMSFFCHIIGNCDIKNYEKEIWLNGVENNINFYVNMHCYSENIYQGYSIINGRKYGKLDCKLKILQLSKGLLKSHEDTKWFDEIIEKLNKDTTTLKISDN